MGIGALLAVGVAFGLQADERGQVPQAVARDDVDESENRGAAAEPDRDDDAFPDATEDDSADTVIDSDWAEGESVRQVLLDSLDMASSEFTAVTYATHKWVEDLASGEWFTVTDSTGAWSWSEVAYDLTFIMDPDGQLPGNPEGMPGWLSMRLIDDIFYMHRPQLADEFDGRTWLMMDAAGDEEGQEMLDYMYSDEGLNVSPAEFTELIELCTYFQWIGEESRDGATVQGFRATASSADLVADGFDLGELGLPDDEINELAALDVPEMFVMEILVDESGYPAEVLYWITLDQTQFGFENYFFDYRTELGFDHPHSDEIIADEELVAAYPGGALTDHGFFEPYAHYDEYFLEIYGETAVERYRSHIAAGESSRV